MRGEGGENCDELCVTGNSTHILVVHDVINVYINASYTCE